MAAPWLAEALRAGGVPVIEEPGSQTRGTGGTFTPLGVLLHHTAGAKTGDLPSLRIVRDGRSDLAGPLSQLMLSRSGVFHVVACGRANHAGARDDGRGTFVPNGDGNRYLIGIEAESTGVADDWTSAQRANYPKGVAALCRYMRVDETRVIGHKEWAPSRKIDPAYWDLNDFRTSVRDHLNNVEDDMTPAELLNTQLRREGPGAVGTTTLGDTVKYLDSNIARILAKIDQTTAAVTALAGLLAAGANDLTAEEIERAVAAAIARTVEFDVTMTPRSA